MRGLRSQFSRVFRVQNLCRFFPINLFTKTPKTVVVYTFARFKRMNKGGHFTKTDVLLNFEAKRRKPLWCIRFSGLRKLIKQAIRWFCSKNRLFYLVLWWRNSAIIRPGRPYGEPGRARRRSGKVSEFIENRNRPGANSVRR